MEVQPPLVHRSLVGNPGRIVAKSACVWSRHEQTLPMGEVARQRLRRCILQPHDDVRNAPGEYLCTCLRKAAMPQPRPLALPCEETTVSPADGVLSQAQMRPW